jgi:P-aminobenzoate N-oxygenase AurF
MRTLEQTVERLCEASRKDYANPYELVWPEKHDRDQWYFSPELISLYGTRFYAELSDADKKKLSFLEAVNFFSLNIHGEKALIEGLAHRLYEKQTAIYSDYLHHFLDEENKHMVYFGGFCMRYAGKVYPDKKMILDREYAPGEEDFLFFAKVMIFEEIVDVYNVRMAQDERLSPIAREINRLHHRDEARHLVFGRQMVQEMFQHYCKHWEAETLNAIRKYLEQYVVATWREYYNPDVYRDLGLSNSYDIYEKAFDDGATRQHRREVTSGCIQYFLNHRILEQDPL